MKDTAGYNVSRLQQLLQYKECVSFILISERSLNTLVQMQDTIDARAAEISARLGTLHVVSWHHSNTSTTTSYREERVVYYHVEASRAITRDAYSMH